MKGSPYWIAPEVVLRQGHSFSADVWAYGCLLIEMYTGRPPWSDLVDSNQDFLQRIMKEDQYPTLPDCSPALRDVIVACLTRNPRERPTADELLLYEFHQSPLCN